MQGVVEVVVGARTVDIGSLATRVSRVEDRVAALQKAINDTSTTTTDAGADPAALLQLRNEVARNISALRDDIDSSLIRMRVNITEQARQLVGSAHADLTSVISALETTLLNEVPFFSLLPFPPPKQTPPSSLRAVFCSLTSSPHLAYAPSFAFALCVFACLSACLVLLEPSNKITEQENVLGGIVSSNADRIEILEDNGCGCGQGSGLLAQCFPQRQSFEKVGGERYGVWA